uniref:MLA13uORF 2a n=1 Tax=Hordeum vulgare TaxID=4513 RepID=Q8GZC8_HORVU|nr:MLA13uORF 2a [Hordeum vulgare]
MLKYLINLRW